MDVFSECWTPCPSPSRYINCAALPRLAAASAKSSVNGQPATMVVFISFHASLNKNLTCSCASSLKHFSPSCSTGLLLARRSSLAQTRLKKEQSEKLQNASYILFLSLKNWIIYHFCRIIICESCSIKLVFLNTKICLYLLLYAQNKTY